MIEFEEKYLAFVDGRIAEHNSLCEKYKEDDRKDEADLEKIKANIYEIFRTLFLTDIKQLVEKDLGKLEDINIYGGFLLRFDTIPANWKISLDKAMEHGDTAKQVIEGHKLEVAKKLKNRFLSMFDELRR
jgi:hypothetical protein